MLKKFIQVLDWVLCDRCGNALTTEAEWWCAKCKQSKPHTNDQ